MENIRPKKFQGIPLLSLAVLSVSSSISNSVYPSFVKVVLPWLYYLFHPNNINLAAMQPIPEFFVGWLGIMFAC